MRQPFRGLLGRSERLLVAGEVELAVITGPLAMPAELAALFSPILSIVLAIQLHGVEAKLLGVILPPAVMVLLARYPLRRWHRPREWIGVTDQRVLVWRRPGAIRAEPRIEEIAPEDIAGVELEQDDWDRRRGTQQVVLMLGPDRARNLGRVANAEQMRDAIIALAPAARPAPPVPPPPLPVDFVPPGAPPPDFRP